MDKKINLAFQLALAFNLGLSSVAFIGLNFSLVLVFLGFVVGLVLLFKRRLGLKFFISLTFAVFSGALVFFTHDFIFRAGALKFDGKICNIVAKVVEVKRYSNGSEGYVMKLVEIDEKKLTPSVLVSCQGVKDFKFSYGDELNAKVQLFAKSFTNSKFAFNQSRAKKIYLNCKILKCFKAFEGKGVLVSFDRARNSLIDAVDCAMNEPFNLLANSMLFGQSFKLPYEIYRSFGRCGLNHIFTVSGLHISILCAFLLCVLKFIRISDKISFLFLVLFLLAYNVLLGFCVSAVRASLMNLAYFLGKIFDSKFKSTHVLCFSATAVLIFFPSSIYSASFALSFSSCLGIALFFKPISKFVCGKFLNLSDWKKFFIDLFAVSVSAMSFSSIFLVLFFNQISLIAPLVNLFVMPLIPLILMSSGLVAITGSLGFFEISNFLAYFCNGVFLVIVKLVNFFAKLPFSCIAMRYFFAPFVLIGLIAFLTFVFFYARQLFYSKLVLLLSCLIVFVPIFNNYAVSSGMSWVSLVGNGTGFSIVIQSLGKVVVLNCGGTPGCEKQLCNFLDSKGIKRIDFLIFLSTKPEYMNCSIPTIVECFETFCVMMPKSIQHEHLINVLAKKNTFLIFEEQAHFENFPVFIDFLKRDNGNEYDCYLNIGGLNFAYSFSEQEFLQMQYMKFANVFFVNDVVDESDEKMNCGFIISLKQCAKQSKSKVSVTPNEISEFVICGSYLKREVM